MTCGVVDLTRNSEEENVGRKRKTAHLKEKSGQKATDPTPKDTDPTRKEILSGEKKQRELAGDPTPKENSGLSGNMTT